MECPTCKGSKVQIVTMQVFGSNVVETSEIGCVTCNGRGTLTRKEAAQLKAEEAMWCQCGEDSTFGSYPQDGECPVKGCIHKHHVHCGKCGKISQIG